MARPYRLQGEGLLYHIASRGDDRKKIFLRETDYQKFLEYLQAAKEKFKFYLYAYCLMGNHYHLLLETTQPNISRVMQYINTSYTVYYNVKRNRCGHLFQGKYKSILVDKDNYLLELTRYIHLNPVRARIVANPQEYKWSSYQDYIERSKAGVVDKTEADKYFKLPPASYGQFVLEGIEKTSSPFAELYAGFILGKEKFIKDTAAALKVQVESEDFAYKKIIRGVEPDIIIQRVANYYKKEVEVLRKAKKRPFLAKKVAVFLLKKLTPLTNKEIGAEFGISYSAVSKISQDMERLMNEDRKIKQDVVRIISHFKV